VSRPAGREPRRLTRWWRRRSLRTRLTVIAATAIAVSVFVAFQVASELLDRELQNTAALNSAVDGSSVTFDYTDGAAGAAVVNQLAANYSGITSPVDTSLPAAEQVIFQRYWNVFLIDLNGSGTPQGKLVQIVVRWKEPNFGYRQVSTSFYKVDNSGFNL